MIELTKHNGKRLVYDINGENGDTVLDIHAGIIVRAKTGIAGTVHALQPIQLTKEMLEAITVDEENDCLRLKWPFDKA